MFNDLIEFNKKSSLWKETWYYQPLFFASQWNIQLSEKWFPFFVLTSIAVFAGKSWFSTAEDGQESNEKICEQDRRSCDKRCLNTVREEKGGQYPPLLVGLDLCGSNDKQVMLSMFIDLRKSLICHLVIISSDSLLLLTFLIALKAVENASQLWRRHCSEASPVHKRIQERPNADPPHY